IAGEWEMIRIRESVYDRQLEAGQIMWGEGSLKKEEWNDSFPVHLNDNGTTSDNGSWSFSKKDQMMTLTLRNKAFRNLHIFEGQDWENQTRTILLTGLDEDGRSVWGKKIK